MANTQELITKAKDFDATNVQYKAPKLNKQGGKNVSLQMFGKSVVLQFPLMMTWGLNEWDSDTGTYKKYDLNLQFNTDDTSTSEGTFRAALQALQDKILNDAVTNSSQWFGKKKMSKEVAEALMYPILKYRKNKETGEPDMTANPTAKLKVPQWEGDFKVELYDMNKKAMYLPQGSKHSEAPDEGWSTPLDLIPSRSYIKGLMECTGIYFVGGKFGVSWKLLQACVRPPVRIQGFCMLDDSDDEEVADALDAEEEDTSPAKITKKKKKKIVRKKKVSAAAT